MTAWKRSDALNGAYGPRHDRLVDEEFVLVGSWRHKALRVRRTMSWQAPGVHSSGRVPNDKCQEFGVSTFAFRAIDHLAG